VRILIAALLLLALGCKERVEMTDPEAPIPTYYVGGGTVEIVTLEDGTKCVVFKSYNAGGIDCNWRTP
jgi:hypothetical protein